MYITIDRLAEEDLLSRAQLLNYLTEAWKEPREEIAANYIRPSFTESLPDVFIAFTDRGDVAGHVMLVIEEKWYLGIDGEPWICGLYVPEEYRGQGVGRRLMETAENACRRHGFNHLYLDTAGARDYYLRLGWEEYGEAWWQAQGKTVTVMRKQVMVDRIRRRQFRRSA
ncbi:MAG TPA: GNAT family N-acetyltransferase [Candidatus Paceibacterota bacterium]|nr:GNAT family N-acetyltransferase [Candidatus Paceibacterota bacterium]